jgi:acetyltransferase
VTQILPYLAKLQIGFSQAFSVGNGADLDLVDCLEYLAEDPETKAIAVYIEGIKRPKDFIQAAFKASKAKPVVALYVGGTEAGSRSAASHTGSISGPDHLYDALFRQAGVIRAYTVEDLFEWAGALSLQPIPKGRNMAILTHSGGPASSLADACNRWQLKVPLFSESLQTKVKELLPATGSFRNPVDLTFFMDMAVMMEKLPQLILEDPEIDGLLIHGVMGSTFFRSVSEIARKWVKVPSYEEVRNFFLGTMDAFIHLPQKYGKPVIASSFGDRDDDAVKMAQDNGIPCFRAPERAVSAMAALCKYGDFQRRI